MLRSVKTFIIIATVICIAQQLHAQAFIGLKAGFNATNIQYESELYKDYYEPKFSPGFSVGAVLLAENKGKFGLYTEFLYSVKGKHVVGHYDDYESNKASYQFLDFPVLFRARFTQPSFSWFLQAGPQLSYWLGGQGAFKVYEPDRNVVTRYNYVINFGEPKNSFDYMDVSDANRVQLGLALGGGVTWELKNANYITVDLRYTMGHTYMGAFESGIIPNTGLAENFEHTNHVLSIAAVYYVNIAEKLKLSKNKYRNK